MPDQVECRSDSEYAESPRSFTWEDQKFFVTQTLARWRTPEGKGFRVETEERALFDLFYDEITDSWSIHPILSK